MRALASLEILDTPEEQEFDELVRLAAEICVAPISTFTLIDRDRQWFKAAVGVSSKQTHRDLSFCSRAIEQEGLFMVENAAADPRFQHNQLVTSDPNIRFYAGMPLNGSEGVAVGTLCVIDTVPRRLSESQQNALMILARQVQARLELRQKQKWLEKASAANEQLLATLRERNLLFSSFMNNGPFVSYIKDAEGRLVYTNEKAALRFGVQGAGISGLKDSDFMAPKAAADIRAHDLEVMSSAAPLEFMETTPDADGTLTHWKSYKFRFTRENGDVMLAGMSLDVTGEAKRQAELDRAETEKRELAQRLESSTILMRTFVENNPNVCYFKSQDGRYLSYNSKFAELFGIGPSEWVGKSDSEVLPIEISERARKLDEEVLRKGQIVEISRHIQNSHGAWVRQKVFKFPIQTADGDKIVAGVAIDITQEFEKERALSEANDKLERLATTDALTGLANRRFFEQRIEIEFAGAARRQRPIALIVLDIDNFKKRNDAYGHAAGDHALRTLGMVLSDIKRVGDLAARIGGEEFAVLLPDTSTEGAILVAERIQESLRTAAGGPMPLTVSIGIASALPGEPTPGQSPSHSHSQPASQSWERLMSLADNAMYLAKRSGKNRIVVGEGIEPVPENPPS